ncbi:hypothetical protein L9F63_019336, partial [Diploptera punctata]
ALVPLGLSRMYNVSIGSGNSDKIENLFCTGTVDSSFCRDVTLVALFVAIMCNITSKIGLTEIWFPKVLKQSWNQTPLVGSSVILTTMLLLST